MKRENIQNVYKLTPMQAGMLYHWMLDRSSDAYCEQYIFTITGVLDKNLVEKSFQKLVQRYDIFRTLFHYQNTKEPLQIVLKQRSFNLHFEDISHINPEEQKKFLEEKKKKNKEIGFDLTKDLLIRTQLFKTNENSYVLVWIFHHILMDGWCMGILFEELITTYRALKNGVPAILEPPVPFCNYLQWLEQQDKEEGLKFWREYLDNYTIQATLPKLNVLPENSVYDHEEYNFKIDELLSGRLEEIAKEKHISLNMLCQAIWGILLQKYNNTNDVVFGSVVLGRPPGIKNSEKMVGLFINTIPVRIKTGDLANFSLLIMQLQQNTLLAKPYEYLPLAEVQATSQLKRDLIDHVMVFENYPIREKLLEINKETDLEFNIDDLSHIGRTNYDFNIIIIPGEQLHISFIFNSRVYKNDPVKKIALHFIEILKQIVVDTEVKLNRVSILCEEEKKQVLYDFNDTTTEYPKDKLIHQLFAEQAARTPDNIAVVGPVQVKYRTHMTYISYRELNQKAHQLAYVLKERGVLADTIVGIMVERSVEMIIGILGILKTGGAYLPIDTGYPEKRINYMLADSGARVLLTLSERHRFNCQLLISLARPHLHHSSFNETPNHSGNLAYIIYTSGSTGKPKGVLLEHRNAAAYLFAFDRVFAITETDILIQQASYSFDVFVEEVYSLLHRGGKLVIPTKEEVMDIHLLSDVIATHTATIISFTPLMLKILNELNQLKKIKTLRVLISGGDTLKPEYIENLMKIGTVYNTYGPTETTVCATYYQCVKDIASHVPIGKPIANYRVYILDLNRGLLPIGVAGELCISGAGVSRGYLNNPELTAEKFQIPNKAGYYRSYRSYKSYILYKTGDLARWLPDGNIEFLGRSDHQVKIRGFRIELGEIERRLLSYDRIKEAVVVDRENAQGIKCLCAYLVPEGKSLNTAEIKTYLCKQLPNYMVPSYFVEIETLPLTTTGKIDRKALPWPKINTQSFIPYVTGKMLKRLVKPGTGGKGTRTAVEVEPLIEKKSQYDAPGDDVDRRLAEIWAEILGLEKSFIKMDADFFQLGGDSILCLQMVLKARQAGITITSTQVFNHPVIEELLGIVKHRQQEESQPSPTPAPLLAMDEKEREQLIADNPGIRDIYQLTPIQQQMFSYNILTGGSGETIMHLSWAMTGHLDIAAFEKAWQTVAQRHCILRTAFKRRRLNEPLQLVYTSITIPFQQLDCSGMTETEQNQALADYLRSDKERRFKMSRAPLMRLCLVILNNHSYRFICSYSSLLLDNWSSITIVKEVFQYYDAYTGKKPVNLEKPRALKDYVQWLLGREETRAKETWRNQLQGFDSPMEPGIQRLSRENINQNFTPAQQVIRLLHRETRQLTTWARAHQLTLGTILQGAWIITLSYLSKEEDVLSGVLSYGRSDDFPGIDSLVGLFINTIPVRVKVPAQQDLIAWLKEFQDQQVRLRQFDYVTIDNISRWSGVPLDIIQKAIYERTFVLAKSPGQEFFSGLTRNNPITISQFDDSLILNVPFRLYAELAEHTIIRLQYDGSCFPPGAIRQVTYCLEKLLKNIIENPGVLLGDLKSNKMMK